MPRFPFVPTEAKFFDFLEKSAHNLVAASQCLVELMEHFQEIDVKQKVAEMSGYEEVGDNITHDIFRQLHRTFVTPFDREDLATLAERLDDIMDLMEEAAVCMAIFKVTAPTETARQLAHFIHQAVEELDRAMPGLRSRSDMRRILPQCVEVNRMENEADNVFRAGLAELFENSMNIGDVIKWREIYGHLEAATDRCEDVANVLEGVVLKNA